MEEEDEHEDGDPVLNEILKMSGDEIEIVIFSE
jgi:hypothetical protein